MARYTGSTFKKSRQYGFSILENNKEFSKGKKRSYRPGQHSNARRKLSDYGLQLQEKQKLRFMYGLMERQFRNTYRKAKKMKGILGTNFLIRLESRLDNICYRLGYASTRAGARQLVNHGHILVNDRHVDIPSYNVVPGDTIKLNGKIKDNELVKKSLAAQTSTLPFVELNPKTLEGKYIRFPQRSELNRDINENLVIEWNSRSN